MYSYIYMHIHVHIHIQTDLSDLPLLHSVKLKLCLAASSRPGARLQLDLLPMWPAWPPQRSVLSKQYKWEIRKQSVLKCRHAGREPEGWRTGEWEGVGFIDRLVWDVLLRGPLGDAARCGTTQAESGKAKLAFQSVCVCVCVCMWSKCLRDACKSGFLQRIT